ncbi:MAG: hypothetical protein ACFFCW_06970, partial [Candidatus Hodarchaeota archaeon]
MPKSTANPTERGRKDVTHLGKLLWKSRFEKRITCYAIARGMGYTNTNKATRKYLRWERGEK